MDIFDTLTLEQVIRVQKPPTTYWLDSFFPRTLTFDTEAIMFDMVVQSRRLAPFVAPNVQGRVMKSEGYNTKVFVPAYSKPKHVMTPQLALPRMAGEAIGGSMSPGERWNAAVAENLRKEKDMLYRLWDWMGCRAVVDGAVTVVGDDYPSKTVNFGRDAALTIQLIGAARWSQTGTAMPLADITSARQSAFDIGRSPITRLTFGLNAWAYFTSIQAVKDLLNTMVRGSDTVYNRAIPEGAPYQFMGTLAGQGGAGALELYTYNDMYQDDNGAETPYMDQDTVVGTGGNIQGVRCFGAIQDKRAGLVATDLFPKMWDVEDPSVTYTMTQSAPLMVPAQPNGSFSIKVV